MTCNFAPGAESVGRNNIVTGEKFSFGEHLVARKSGKFRVRAAGSSDLAIDNQRRLGTKVSEQRGGPLSAARRVRRDRRPRFGVDAMLFAIAIVRTEFGEMALYVVISAQVGPVRSREIGGGEHTLDLSI